MMNRTCHPAFVSTVQIDAIVITISANLEDSGGGGGVLLAHIAFLSTIRPQILRSLGQGFEGIIFVFFSFL